MVTRFRRGVTVLLVLLLLPAVPAEAAVPAKAAVPATRVEASGTGTAFYVDNRTGTQCSNTGPGTTSDAPWCDFTPVNDRTYGPGDHILLARGATWNQQMTLRGAGTADAPVVLDAYGTGARPRIIRNGQAADRGIRLDNPSHWSIANLEIGNAGVGLLVFFTELRHENLSISDLYVHDITGIRGPQCTADKVFISAGIEFTGTPPPFGASDYALRRVRITNVEGTRNDNSVSFDWCNGLTAPLDGTSGDGLVRDVELNGLNLHGDDGAGRSAGCEGLRLVNVRDVTVLNSTLWREAACPTPSGTAAVFLGRVRNVAIVNSMITAVPDTGSPDQVAVNYETRLDGVRVLNSYLAGNAGPAVALHAIWGASDYSTNTEISGNYFDRNALARREPCLGAISRGNNQSRPTGVIRDNVYTEPTGLLGTCHGGTFDGFTVTNNAPVATASYAAQAYNGTILRGPWLYQYSANGSTWQPMAYDRTAGRWTHASGGSIGRFDQRCDGCRVARAWRPDRAGTVTIRGRALTSAPDGGDATARITLNGTTVWGPATISARDRAGTSTDVHRLAVAPGDVVRFETSGAAVSWSPLVSYPESARSWEFDGTVNPYDGWSLTSQLTGAASDGVLRLTSTGDDPFLHSPDTLNLDARTVRTLEIRARNGTPSPVGEVFFVTDADRVWTAAKRVGWQQRTTADGFTIYTVDMGANPAWTGTVRQLRLDPATTTGPYDVDYIRVY